MKPTIKKWTRNLHNNLRHDAELNMAQRQAIVRQMFNLFANQNNESAPVALLCIAVKPDGQATTTMVNIEPEQAQIILKASAEANQKIEDFFAEVQSNSAKIHYLTPK